MTFVLLCIGGFTRKCPVFNCDTANYTSSTSFTHGSGRNGALPSTGHFWVNPPSAILYILKNGSSDFCNRQRRDKVGHCSALSYSIITWRTALHSYGSILINSPTTLLSSDFLNLLFRARLLDTLARWNLISKYDTWRLSYGIAARQIEGGAKYSRRWLHCLVLTDKVWCHIIFGIVKRSLATNNKRFI